METLLSHTTVYKPAKADYSQYTSILDQVRRDLDKIDKAIFRLGRNLDNIKRRQLYLYGDYTTFTEFCTQELGKSRQQIFRVMQGYDTMRALLEAGIPESDLPSTERLCREMRKLDPEVQAAVWKLVLKRSRAQGKAPTRADVLEAAVEVDGSLETRERQQKELLQKIEGAGRALKVGLSIDTLTPSFRFRLIVSLSEIAETVQSLMAALRSQALAEANPSDDEEQVHAESEQPEEPQSQDEPPNMEEASEQSVQLL